MSSIRLLIPLLIAAGILLGGNGMQSTLIALRGAQEGFSPAVIGFMGTSYFGGFLLGCLAITRIMKAVGHVRSFSALAAIASAGTLLLVLIIDPISWSVIRFASGFCFAGLFTVMESWLNSGVSNHDRARVLALYRIVDIGSVTGAQFMIPIFGSGGFTLFAIMSIMITLSLVPVSLGDRSNPTPPEDVKLDLGRVWLISPLGCIGCIAVGVTNSAFRTLSPVYAEEIGMSVADIVTFVSVGIVGGAIIQYPLGYLSDLWDRRMVLLLSTSGALLSALGIVFLAGTNPLANFVLVFIFGSFAMPLFSLSAAHANDRAGKGEFVLINAALMLFYSFGAIGGPIAASWVMERFGPQSLFIFTATVYAIFILIIFYRMSARGSVPAGQRSHFMNLLRTSTVFSRLAKRNGDSDKPPSKP
ncbi:Predicted arabinose efflux permease, MFS family [Mesorhizobium albiziae]|uniref:Predicted arabinose efflux permease, MFS family n=1 Tax=Neomesorhizobium albiziae TaxID=335020 RepID=A0A1I4DBL0_9HYPH|nr:MFS transporter [Mesorhizobium albiziae]GLS32328.1 MFS transporter [Mesorhizobium albiziae]SFK90882.1 Predicted arabinose efflux permease, MFS family [Mesorhizobium albiziae]